MSEGDRAYKGIVTPNWKVVGAVVRGSSHVQTGQPCQDAFDFAIDGDWLVAVVCDGAGSAQRGGEGASLLSQAVVRGLAKAIASGEERLLDQIGDLVCVAIEGVRKNIEDPDDPNVLRAHHATLVGVLVGPEGGCFFHIGDGAAAADIGVQEDPWRKYAVSQPENGEYANETFFFTETDWRTHLRFLRFSSAQRLVLMSDGASCFSMLGDSSAPDMRFLGPVSRYLDDTDAESGAVALAGTLGSEKSQEISSDDKTMIWASRGGKLES